MAAMEGGSQSMFADMGGRWGSREQSLYPRDFDRFKQYFQPLDGPWQSQTYGFLANRSLSPTSNKGILTQQMPGRFLDHGNILNMKVSDTKGKVFGEPTTLHTLTPSSTSRLLVKQGKVSWPKLAEQPTRGYTRSSPKQQATNIVSPKSPKNPERPVTHRSNHVGHYSTNTSTREAISSTLGYNMLTTKLGPRALSMDRLYTFAMRNKPSGGGIARRPEKRIAKKLPSKPSYITKNVQNRETDTQSFLPVKTPMDVVFIGDTAAASSKVGTTGSSKASAASAAREKEKGLRQSRRCRSSMLTLYEYDQSGHRRHRVRVSREAALRMPERGARTRRSSQSTTIRPCKKLRERFDSAELISQLWRSVDERRQQKANSSREQNLIYNETNLGLVCDNTQCHPDTSLSGDNSKAPDNKTESPWQRSSLVLELHGQEHGLERDGEEARGSDPSLSHVSRTEIGQFKKDEDSTGEKEIRQVDLEPMPITVDESSVTVNTRPTSGGVRQASLEDTRKEHDQVVTPMIPRPSVDVSSGRSHIPGHDQSETPEVSERFRTAILQGDHGACKTKLNYSFSPDGLDTNLDNDSDRLHHPEPSSAMATSPTGNKRPHDDKVILSAAAETSVKTIPVKRLKLTDVQGNPNTCSSYTRDVTYTISKHDTSRHEAVEIVSDIKQALTVRASPPSPPPVHLTSRSDSCLKCRGSVTRLSPPLNAYSRQMMSTQEPSEKPEGRDDTNVQALSPRLRRWRAPMVPLVRFGSNLFKRFCQSRQIEDSTPV